MTEAEWLAGNDPFSMFAFMRLRTSSRKLQLFGCGCCREVWELLVDEGSRKALQIMEEDADDDTENEHFRTIAHRNAAAACRKIRNSRNGTSDAAATVFDVAHRSPLESLFDNLEAALGKSRRVNKPAVRQMECGILRELFGNPFRPVTAAPEWLTSDVLALSTGIYEERAFDRLPILADALQDAGCDTDDLLNHLRGDGSHVRGCWALDLVLGKS